MALDLQALEPVLGALVGGGLAIAGGVLTARLTARRELRDLHLKKLEEVHAVAADVMRWGDVNVQQATVAPLGESAIDLQALKSPVPIERLIMLAEVYEPTLRSRASTMKAAVDRQRQAQFDFWKAMAGGDAPASAPPRFQALSTAHEELKEAYHSLEVAVVRAAQRRLR